MSIAQTCMNHAYCTDCPSRKECTVRQCFYSQGEYDEMIDMIRRTTLRIISFMRVPPYVANLQINTAIQMMNNRRKRELELHPTYCAD
ncbi:MAG: hypothetical protein HFJ17_01755 [Clostridia bacterium]|nr:hypothetical protein [Clostridia bacterium]